MSTPIWIVGAGAVGQYLAARLSAVVPVTLVGRRERCDALSGGIALEGAESGRAGPEVMAVEDHPVPPPGAFVLYTVKATQLEAALGSEGIPAGPGQRIALCQNGIGVETLAAARAPHAIRVRAACWFGVSLTGPATVRVAGVYQLALGADTPDSASAAHTLSEIVTAAGLPVAAATSVAECEWKKSLWNLAVSGVCALLDTPNGIILDDPGLRALASDVLAEARAVAAAEGVVLTDDDLARVFASTEKTRLNLNAMVHDLRRGAPTETPFLASEVARLADKHGLPAPLNRTLARLLSAAESRWRRNSP